VRARARVCVVGTVGSALSDCPVCLSVLPIEDTSSRTLGCSIISVCEEKTFSAFTKIQPNLLDHNEVIEPLKVDGGALILKSVCCMWICCSERCAAPWLCSVSVCSCLWTAQHH